MTERPEERDSLALIEERLARDYVRGSSSRDDLPRAEQAIADLRALINEVKERREERDNAINAEKVALRYAGDRIAQMEEALRDCLRHLDFEAGDDDQYATGARMKARAALSPSDTETRS